MPDISQQWGSDLSTNATGDLATITGTTLGQQRVLRRLLTNPGEYIWQRDYGAGLGQFIGQPGNASQIRAAIRSQMFKEASVARSPEPLIDIDLSETSSSGAVYVQIRYVDAPTGQTQYLSFPLGR
jgi:phage baseplate assembly protein W